MGVFLQLIFYFAILAFDAFDDYFKIEKKGRQIKHDRELIVPTFAYLGIAVAGVWSGFLCWVHAASVLASWLPVRWILHDFLLNLYRGKPLDYLGSDQHSASTDKLLNRLAARGYNQWVVKVSILAIILLFSGVASLLTVLI